MKRIIYLDCYSGASGDMLLGALLDAGLSLEDLRADLARLDLDGYELTAESQTRHGIVGTKFDVVDLAGEHPARNLGVVRDLIEGSDLSDRIKARSIEVFTRLAEAEAHVHGTTVDAIHFHEVGAVDAVVDIVGFCCALERLEIEAVYSSALPLGSGMVRTEHGLLPVPAPATLELLAAVGVPIAPSDAKGELVTPTGAALLSALACFQQPAMRVRRVGYGFGTREFPWPNAVRVWLGEEIPARHQRPSAAGGPGHDHHHHHHHAHAHGHPHAHDHPHGHDHAHEQEV
ncbi:MAG TPA: nickel pincer cofactor biosynthesis protein LarC [Chloroflexi bacterium]|nr:nickel pincer cofactor biosynthesis protein LarC [Chloroflexota bacterium]